MPLPMGNMAKPCLGAERSEEERVFVSLNFFDKRNNCLCQYYITPMPRVQGWAQKGRAIFHRQASSIWVKV